MEGQSKDQQPLFFSPCMQGDTVMSSLCNKQMWRACVHERGCTVQMRAQDEVYCLLLSAEFSLLLC